MWIQLKFPWDIINFQLDISNQQRENDMRIRLETGSWFPEVTTVAGG